MILAHTYKFFILTWILGILGGVSAWAEPPGDECEDILSGGSDLSWMKGSWEEYAENLQGMVKWLRNLEKKRAPKLSPPRPENFQHLEPKEKEILVSELLMPALAKHKTPRKVKALVDFMIGIGVDPVLYCVEKLRRLDPRTSLQDRERYIIILRNIGSKEAIDFLFDILADPDHDLADAVAVALSKVKPKWVISKLLDLDLEEHENPHSVLMALNLIARRLKPNDHQRERIIEFYQKYSTIEQQGAARMRVIDEGSYVHAYQVALDKVVESKNLAERKRALATLKKAGSEFIPFLEDVLRTDKRIYARLLAVRLLSKFTTVESLQALMGVVRSQDTQPYSVRHLAWLTLSQVIQPDVGADFQQLIGRFAAEESVTSLSQENPDPQDIKILENFWSDMDKLGAPLVEEQAEKAAYAQEHAALDTLTLEYVLKNLNDPHNKFLPAMLVKIGPACLPVLFDILGMDGQDLAHQKIYHILNGMGEPAFPLIAEFVNSAQSSYLSKGVVARLVKIVGKVELSDPPEDASRETDSGRVRRIIEELEEEDEADSEE